MIPGAVSVGFLHPGQVSAVFTKSLMEAMFVSAGRIVTHNRGYLAKHCGAGQLVESRNKVTAAFLEGDAEWLFFVDSDMGFAPDTIERLIAAADPVDRPVVGALCFAHKNAGDGEFGAVRYVAQPTVYGYFEDDTTVGFFADVDYERDALSPVSATGAACILIHRNAAEILRDRVGPEWWTPITHPKGPTTFSEDLSFCFKLAACDVPLYVHTGVKTTHDKGGVFLDESYFDTQQRCAGIDGAPVVPRFDRKDAA